LIQNFESDILDYMNETVKEVYEKIGDFIHESEFDESLES